MGICATKLGATPGVVGDVDKIRDGFVRSFVAMRSQNTPGGMIAAGEAAGPVVPKNIAANGAGDPNRAVAVDNMLKCMGDTARLNPAMTNELRLMYSDAVGAQNYGTGRMLEGRIK